MTETLYLRIPIRNLTLTSWVASHFTTKGLKKLESVRLLLQKVYLYLNPVFRSFKSMKNFAPPKEIDMDPQKPACTLSSIEYQTLPFLFFNRADDAFCLAHIPHM